MNYSSPYILLDHGEAIHLFWLNISQTVDVDLLKIGILSVRGIRKNIPLLEEGEPATPPPMRLIFITCLVNFPKAGKGL